MNTKRRFIDTVIQGLAVSGAPSVGRKLAHGNACILMLHGLTDRLHHEGIGNSEDLHIHVDDFHSICDLLASHYHVVSLDELVHSIVYQEPIKPGTVVLTFDDGYRSNHEFAYPILRQYGLHGTIFVASRFVDEQAWLWWDRLEYAIGHTSEPGLTTEIRGETMTWILTSELQRRETFLALLPRIKACPQETIYEEVARIEASLQCGLDQADEVPSIYLPFNWDQAREMNESEFVSIGAHTHHHYILGRCREETARREMERCLSLLETNLDIVHPLFSYPNGHGPAGDHTATTREIVKDAGCRCALTTDNGLNDLDSDLFTLKRFSTGNSSAYVDVTVSGILSQLVHLKQAVLPQRRAA